MTQLIDTSELTYCGLNESIEVNIAANTTLKEGTILGVHKTSSKIVAYDSTNCPGNEFYILLAPATNSTAAAADIKCQVLGVGEINRSKLKIADGSSVDAVLIARLKSSGIIPINVHEQTKEGAL